MKPFQYRDCDEFAFNVLFDLTDQEAAQVRSRLLRPFSRRQLADWFLQHLLGDAPGLPIHPQLGQKTR
jgi:hypothetical protein